MLRLIRYYELAFATILREPALRILLFATLAILSIGTVVYRIVEEWGWVESFYFCVITLTTIGYGDLSPSSDFTRLFTALYAFLGIGILATFITVLIRAPFIERQSAGRDSASNQARLVLPERPRDRRHRWGTAPLRNRR